MLRGFDLKQGELIQEWTEEWTAGERSGAALKLYGQLREKVRATELKGYVRDGADFGRKLRERIVLLRIANGL